MTDSEKLQDGLKTAFFDRTFNSNLAYRPEFISNDNSQGKRVIASIEDELLNCDEFMISVAFITRGGITPLLQTLKELEGRHIPGKILTTDYLSFSDPEALKKLHSLHNIELRMYRTEDSSSQNSEGFHTKGYIFRDEELYRIIIGSSNMTASALKVNKEWNMKVVGYESGEVVHDVLKEFNELWTSPKTARYDGFIEEYQAKYDIISEQKRRALQENPVPISQYKLTPNSMQTAFISNLRKLVAEDKDKALLISATGTGKTYASAFAMREMNPKKFLFIVHRERIAKQAMGSYRRVFGKYSPQGKKYQYALLSGSTSSNLDKIREADFIFATMQMMSKKDVLYSFSPDAFSEICIDEAHHSGAESYRRIMSYFHPDFWLGMTASPDTTRFNVYKLFDYNIAYEIRLQQALEENLLCPFHYFGITDIAIDGRVIGDQDHEEGLRNFNRLVSDDRVNYIIRQADYYGHSGNRVKGIIFCSSKDEAHMLSDKFNRRGLRTVALTGEDSENVRESALERLAMDVPKNELHDRSHPFDPSTDKGYLDYIFAIDILSEGVDVPEINQVIMLRPTQSAIVFIQQLGRGLRKSEGKEYVVVLDFIGNYQNNFLIPIALSGDNTYKKDNVRRYLMEGDRIIPGVSTIHFDEISRKQIFRSIDNANFSAVKLIKESYQELKNKIGRIPSLKDFDDYGSMDVCRIFDNPGLGSYYNFLKKYEPDYKVTLTSEEAKYVEFISKKLANGKRIQELALLNRLLRYHHGILQCVKPYLKTNYNIVMNSNEQENVIHVMTNEFSTGAARNTYKDCIFLVRSGNDYNISPDFEKMLHDRDFYLIVKELIDFGISRYRKNYSNRYHNTNFVLYQKYTYEDVCRLLDWDKNVNGQNIGGYFYDAKTKTFPVFINYVKDDSISDTTKYEDRFIDRKTLIAISKNNRTPQSPEVQNFLHAKERGIHVYLFVRKNKNDKNVSKEFYCLGEMSATGNYRPIQMANTQAKAVEIEWSLESPVREDIYQYLTS